MGNRSGTYLKRAIEMEGAGLRGDGMYEYMYGYLYMNGILMTCCPCSLASYLRVWIFERWLFGLTCLFTADRLSGPLYVERRGRARSDYSSKI